MNIWLVGPLAAAGLALFGWMCWRLRTRRRDERPTRPGDDTQFARWLSDQELADRAERRGDDG